MAAINAKLRQLRLRRPDGNELKEIKRQIVNEINDRGAAVLAATLVENALVWAISRHIRNVAIHAALFDNNGPLSTFDARIVVAAAFSIVGEKTRKNLDLIKHIRNTFAHAGIPVTFQTAEIAEGCEAIDAWDGKASFQSTRNRFIAACYTISDQLSDYGARYHFARADIIAPATMVPVPPPSLP